LGSLGSTRVLGYSARGRWLLGDPCGQAARELLPAVIPQLRE
jgi:hypothetical protein